MNRQDYGFSYKGEPIFTYIQRDAPHPPESKLDEDFFVYVMGPYTAFDASHAYTDSGKLETPFIEDSLFDPKRHITNNDRSNYEAALNDVCSWLRDEFGVRAFLATDINIPTEKEADEGEESKSVLDQSVEFAAVSDAVIFIFSEAGLTTGTGAEVGAILGEFHLREGNLETIRKPRERFRIFKTEGFTSASINEIPITYDIDTMKFEEKDDLIDKVQQFLANIERNDSDRQLPIFNAYTNSDSE